MTSEDSCEPAIKIDRMQDGDLISVVDLEDECELNSRGIERYRTALSDPNAILLVARVETDTLVGLFTANLVLDELQIDNLAVAPQWRRRRIASRLILRGFDLASQHGTLNAFLEVRAANRAAIAFYRKLGFSILGTRIAYYQNPPDDALTMACRIGGLLEKNPVKKI
jgi:[ribosomal protein S18]-alanine N-acetyltransferase